METRHFLKLEELVEDPIIESKEKDVKIYGLTSIGRKLDILGYVESESRSGAFHRVSAEYEPSSKNLIYGNCDCEAYEFFGNPCKHILKLRNVYIRNSNRPNQK